MLPTQNTIGIALEHYTNDKPFPEPILNTPNTTCKKLYTHYEQLEKKIFMIHEDYNLALYNYETK